MDQVSAEVYLHGEEAKGDQMSDESARFKGVNR